MKGFVALAATVGMLAAASSAQAAPQWSDGTIQKSFVTNCPSIIFGTPMQEEGAWTWSGQFLDIAQPPDINTTFYVHVVVGAVGNPCPGGQYAHFEIEGPPVGDISTAITGATPVFCYAINWNNNPPTASQEPAYGMGGQCPQTPQPKIYASGAAASFDRQTGPTTTAPWPFSQGTGWEIQIPVQNDVPMNGGANDSNRFLTKVIDGNSSPLLETSKGLLVDGGGGGGGTPSGTGGTGGNGGALKPNPTPAAPAPPATATTTAPKKCKKNQKLKKGKCVKKKRKKK